MLKLDALAFVGLKPKKQCVSKLGPWRRELQAPLPGVTGGVSKNVGDMSNLNDNGTLGGKQGNGTTLIEGGRKKRATIKTRSTSLLRRNM
jgi:hypothetical protein